MQGANVLVNHPCPSEVHDIMHRHDVGKNGSDEALAMGLVFKLTGNL